MSDDLTRLDAATAHLDPPFAVVDVPAFQANAEDLVRRAKGTPIRVASKSVRCRELLDAALAVPGFHGVMSYSLAESIWLAENGIDDILLAYPTTNRTAISSLASRAKLAERITLMVDDPAQLDLVDSVVAPSQRPVVQVCLDIDASLRVLGVHLGVRRSPLRTARDARSLAEQIQKRPGFDLVGVMFYDAQVAGLPDSSAAVRMVKRRSLDELGKRRAEVVQAVRDVVDMRLVNGGGSGSVAEIAADPTITEVTAGSGLYGPALFDDYRSFHPRPAAMFALPVVRRPARRVVTAFSGGYPASGPAEKTRLPLPWLPHGLELLGGEGAGEVQTPVRGRAAKSLKIGDRVWFRHAKAGELCERFDELHLISGDEITETVPTYRGEGKNFG